MLLLFPFKAIAAWRFPAMDKITATSNRDLQAMNNLMIFSQENKECWIHKRCINAIVIL